MLVVKPKIEINSTALLDESLGATALSQPANSLSQQTDIDELEARLHCVIGDQLDEGEGLKNSSLFADAKEDQLDGAEQDTIMKQLLEQGIDLRQYSKQIEQELAQVENEHVLDYVRQSQSLAMLQGDIKACDVILERMQTFLSSFQSELGKVNREIQDLQGQSQTLETKVKNRALVQRQLNAVLDGILLGPDLVTKICEGEVNEFYLEHLRELDRKMAFVKAQKGKNIRAFNDVTPEFERLRLRASEKNRDYLLDKIRLLKVVGNHVSLLQTKDLLPFRDLYSFLAERFKEVALEVRQTYINTMSAYYKNAFYRYLKLLQKVSNDPTAKFEWVGGGNSLNMLSQPDESSLFAFSQASSAGGATGALSLSASVNASLGKNASMFTNVVDGVSKLSATTYNTISTLSSSMNRSAGAALAPESKPVPFIQILKERLNVIRSVNMAVVPIAEGELDCDDGQSFTLEALFKSLHRTWVDSVSSEFIFINEFFVVPLHQKNQQRRSAARKAAPNSSEESRQVETIEVVPATAIWLEILDPTLKYLVGSIKSWVNQCFDAICILQCIRLNTLNVMVMQKRNIPVLDSFFDAINLMLWPRFQTLLEGHVKSVREADTRRLIRALFNPAIVQGATMAQVFESSTEFEIAEVLGPHPITRRFAEFAATAIALNDGFNDAVLTTSLIRLRSEMENFLTRMAEEIPAVAANSGKQRYRTMFYINNLDLIATVLGNSATLSKACDIERNYYLNKIEKILYNGKT